jgi:hypothetical protein
MAKKPAKKPAKAPKLSGGMQKGKNLSSLSLLKVLDKTSA